MMPNRPPTNRPPTAQDRPQLPAGWRIVRVEEDAAPSPRQRDSAAKYSQELTLKEFFEQVFWEELEGRQSATKTVGEYAATMKLWECYTGCSICDINTKTLQKFSGWLMTLPGRKNDTISHATRAKHLRNVLAILRFCAKKGYIHPVEFRMPKKVSHAPQGAIGIDQIAAWVLELQRCELPLARLVGQPRGPWWVAICYVFFYTGLRPCAALRLKYDDMGPIDEFGGRPCEVRPEINKCDMGFWHYLHPECVAAIGRLKRRGGRFLFGSWWPNLVSDTVSHHDHARQTLSKIANRAAVRAGVRLPAGNVWKCFRKTHATELSKISSIAVDISLGHSVKSVTQQHYLDHETVLREAILQMPSLDTAIKARRKHATTDA